MDKKAFTLVELIVVITILSVLATVAFISFQWYAASSRDSVRLSDLKSMEKVINLYRLTNSKYPTPNAETNITYSGSIAWTQWVFWTNAYTKNTNLSDVPVDPITDFPYAYSVTNTKWEYEIAAILEWEISASNTQTYAWNQIASVYVRWDYNGKIIRVRKDATDYILWVPSIIASDINDVRLETILTNQKLVYKWYSNLPASYSWSVYNSNPVNGFSFVPNQVILFEWDIDDLESNPSDRIEFLDNLQTNYSWTIIASEWNIAEILAVDSSSNSTSSNYVATILNNNLKTKIQIISWWSTEASWSIALITSSDCNNAGWFWVDEPNDVYIWSNQGVWFCISPRYWDWNNDSGLWNWGISWNGWWALDSNIARWWNANSVDDSWNTYNIGGQTRTLDSEVSYNCKEIWTAVSDFDVSDTVVWRMKWLASTWNNYDDARNIDWITELVPHSEWTYPQAIPAIYIADCIDGIKDLWTDMYYSHQPDEWLNEIITYSDYSVNAPYDINANITSNNIYYDRQKYLIAWTQKTWSHLPSAMSYITTGYITADNPSGDFLTGNARGEYQVACEWGKFWTTTWNGTNQFIGSSDDINNENILTSSLGNTNGWNWVVNSRTIGATGCSDQNRVDSGARRVDVSARFVVRP